jgi:putative membrane protein
MRSSFIVPALALFAVSVSPALAQSSSPQSKSATPPAVSTSNSESKTTAAPVPGKNSFTKAEARKRLKSFGYTNVSTLHQDNQSIWRGRATKDGRRVSVSVDYQGNIVAQ